MSDSTPNPYRSPEHGSTPPRKSRSRFKVRVFAKFVCGAIGVILPFAFVVYACLRLGISFSEFMVRPLNSSVFIASLMTVFPLGLACLLSAWKEVRSEARTHGE